jgi:hypothetical protein
MKSTKNKNARINEFSKVAKYNINIQKSTVFLYTSNKQKLKLARCQWLIPITLATQKAAIRRIPVQDQFGQIVPNTKQDWWRSSSGSACLASMRLNIQAPVLPKKKKKKKKMKVVVESPK